MPLVVMDAVVLGEVVGVVPPSVVVVGLAR
jgi:hypothetical protein